jgi:toxin YoeB
MMQILFSPKAWNQYLYWQGQDRRAVKRINDLLEDIGRGGHQGIGKPEPLKENFSGFWSRRIDEKNRLVYRIHGNICEVVQCKGHYDD